MVDEKKKRGVVGAQVDKFKNFFFSSATKVSGERFPGFQRFTSNFSPLEKDLNKLGLTVALKQFVDTLEDVEKKWYQFGKEWEKLISLYAHSKKGDSDTMASFYRSNAILKEEYGRVKYGTGATEAQIKSESDQVAGAAAEGEELQDTGGGENGDIKSSAENKEVRIYVGNLIDKDNSEILKATRYKMEYPVPKTVYQRYWHSLMNDKDECVNDWEYSYFGYNAKGTWIAKYQKVISDACIAMQSRILGEDILTKDKVDKDSLKDEEIRNITTNIPKIMRKFHTYVEKFMTNVAKREGKLYGHLRSIGINAINLDNMASSFSGENLPSHAIKGIGKIYFKHSYHIINPERLIDAWSWNNIVGLYKEIVRVIRIIFDNEIELELEAIESTSLLDELHRNPKYRWMRHFWAAYEADYQKRRFLRPVLTTRNDGIYNEYKHTGKDYSMNDVLEMMKKDSKKNINEKEVLDKLKKLFMKLNNILENPEQYPPLKAKLDKEKDIKVRKKKIEKLQNSSFFMWSPEDLERSERIGEIAPGWDENGWPLEVADKDYDIGEYKFNNLVEALPGGSKKEGAVLLDMFNWHKRKDMMPKPRRVDKKFIVEMDLLMKATSLHNEWDAIRDDLRDGRYHIGSLTITDYAIAQKRVIGGKPITPAKTEFGSVFMMGEKSLEAKAKLYKMEKVPQNPRYYKMKLGGDGGSVKDIRIASNMNPAFDRRALKKGIEGAGPKDWWHIGRKRYYDWAEMCNGDLDETENKKLIEAHVIGPALSTRGMSMYIIEKVMQNVVHYEDARKILLRIVGDGWYDYGPRRFNVIGSKDPFNLDSAQIQSANESLLPRGGGT
jgi:hypothetical protein